MSLSSGGWCPKVQGVSVPKFRGLVSLSSGGRCPKVQVFQGVSVPKFRGSGGLIIHLVKGSGFSVPKFRGLGKGYTTYFRGYIKD